MGQKQAVTDDLGPGENISDELAALLNEVVETDGHRVRQITVVG